jgi:hypothetical protein
MNMYNFLVCSCERCINSEQNPDGYVSFFLGCIYEIIMAIILELSYCNSCTATLLTAIKKRLKLSNITFN